MTILFTASVRGGRSQQPLYVEIVDVLQKFGTVRSEHVAHEEISHYGETDLTKEEIHDRELSALHDSDVIVAEVSVPSLGVGYMIAQALLNGKRVICLYQGEDTFHLSAMIKGNRNVEVVAYQKSSELEKIFQEKLGSGVNMVYTRERLKN